MSTSCPQCKGLAPLIVGLAAFPHEMGTHKDSWFVCWDCRVRAKCWRPWRELEWNSFDKAVLSKDTPSWKKSTQWHWQTVVDGDLLDYWPSKKKFRWRGETIKGDVDEFIRENSP
jgi:hypothetical protein